jgi:hypothetical protein
LEDAWLLRAEDPMVARKAMTIESILNRAPKENLLKERLTQLGRQRLFSMKGYRFGGKNGDILCSYAFFSSNSTSSSLAMHLFSYFVA